MRATYGLTAEHYEAHVRLERARTRRDALRKRDSRHPDAAVARRRAGMLALDHVLDHIAGRLTADVRATVARASTDRLLAMHDGYHADDHGGTA